MAKIIKQLDLQNGPAFASELEMFLDNGNVLVDIQVDHPNAIATCTLDDRDGSETIPPTKKPFQTDIVNGVAFAEWLWMHTDLGNKLIWMVIHEADNTADCWFE